MIVSNNLCASSLCVPADLSKCVVHSVSSFQMHSHYNKPYIDRTPMDPWFPWLLSPALDQSWSFCSVPTTPLQSPSATILMMQVWSVVVSFLCGSGGKLIHISVITTLMVTFHSVEWCGLHFSPMQRWRCDPNTSWVCSGLLVCNHPTDSIQLH